MARLGNQVADRVLQPFARRVAADVDLDHQRQAGEEQLVGMPLASEITANEPGDLTTATQLHAGQFSGEKIGKQGPAVDVRRRRTVRDGMGVAVRDDQDVAGSDRHGRVRNTNDRFALGHQMIADQPLGSRSEHMRGGAKMRHLEAPGRRAFSMKEDRARHADRFQRFRQSVHRSLHCETSAFRSWLQRNTEFRQRLGSCASLH